MNKQIKIGVIGCGQRAGLIKFLIRENIVVHGVFDPSEKMLNKFLSATSLSSWVNYLALLTLLAQNLISLISFSHIPEEKVMYCNRKFFQR